MQGVIRVQGVLQGLDQENVNCELMTWKESSTSGRVYTRCRIVNEPPDLPEGPYILFFAGRSIPTRKFDGCWMLSFLPADIDLEQDAAA